ncbi:MAG: amino acid adenylation domain-containing protein, partial [Chitinophagaceae bacterium]
GIVQAGAVYVPFNTGYPAERLEYIIENAGITHVLYTDEELLYKCGLQNQRVISVQECLMHEAHKEIIETGIDAGVYIMYTSGTTGNPKGILVNQRNILKLVYDAGEIAVNQDDVVIQWSNYSFDGSTYEIYSALLKGAKLCMIADSAAADVFEIARVIEDHGVTIFFITTALFNSFVDTELGVLKGLRKILFGGEMCSMDHVRKALRVLGPGKIIHVYGPTETTVYATAYPLYEMGSWSTLPIGRPLSNTEIVLLNSDRQQVPVGVLGELFIGGEGVSLGYVNNEELTAQKFVSIDGHKGTWYRTGDFGRWLEDGSIEFFGRKDDQVKIRGYRIELGEIESVLRQAEGISQCVVMARTDKQGEKRVIGYIVPANGYSKEEVTNYMRTKLPDYMVPSMLVEMESIPLNSSGKVDRKKLPEPDSIAANASNNYAAPENEIEEKLSLIWQELLGLERAGRNDNFFEMGGHSLLAIQLISAIRKEFDKEVAIKDVFDCPTIAELATQITNLGATDTLPPIERYDRPEHIPLSFSQERLWFIDRLQGSVQYHMPWVFKLTGKLNVASLNQSFKTVVNRHEVLRTVIREEDGVSYQLVMPADAWEMDCYEMEEVTNDDKSWEDFITEYIQKPYDLSHDPMLRVALIRLSDKEHIFAAVVHHIAFDGLSISVMVDELAETYRSLQENRESTLQSLPVQYADYAIWQHKHLSGVLEQKLNWWTEKLKGIEPLELPVDFARPQVQSVRGGIVEKATSKQLYDGLQALSQQQGVTLFMTLLSVYKILLHRYTSQSDICVGIPIAGRQHNEVEGLIGFFVNTLALRSDVRDEMNYNELLQQVRQTTLDAYEHQQVPFEKIVKSLAVDRDRSRTPLFQVMFSLMNATDSGGLDLGGVDLHYADMGRNNSKFDLILTTVESQDGIQIGISYCSDLFREETVRQILEHYESLLHAVVADANVSVGKLPMLAEPDYIKLAGFNDIALEYPRDKSIMQVFAERVEQTPDAIALLAGEDEITYRQLAERAGSVAACLLAKGVEPGERIGLLSYRGTDMIAAMLGIVQAGAVYVPFNTGYPAERLEYIIENAGISHVLYTSEELLGKSGLQYKQVISMQECLDYPQHKGIVQSGPDAAVYIMYTSGTTGNPKGILVNQLNILKLVYDAGEIAVNSNDVVIQWSNYSFDGSTYEIYSALLKGARLCLIPDSAAADVFEIARVIEEKEVTIFFITTALFNGFVDTELGVLKGLRKILFGGEMCSMDHVRKALRVLGPGKIVHVYGPTETTVYATAYPLHEMGSWISLPIGRPLSNTQILLLDGNHQQVPVGVLGELYIGGEGVAMGYVNNKELTEQKFVSIKGHEGTWYRTGDFGRWLDDGSIEFFGRKDDQVKIRGYRIELGEVESVLRQANGISQCVVIAKKDHNGDKRLVGYIVPTHGYNKDALMSYLRLKLPEYMVPAVLVEMESIPLNSSGKVDRKKLPEPGAVITASNNYEAPQTETEKQLASIWQRLLGIERVSIHDNFFELGGHSLLALKLIAAIRKEIGTETPIRQIFDCPTIATLAEQIAGHDKKNALPPVEKCERNEQIPLSFAQERLWFIDRLQGSVQYHMPWVFRLTGKLNVEVLGQSFKTIVNRHEVLRTVIAEQQGVGYQQITDAGEWKMDYINEEAIISAGATTESYIENYIGSPYDLSKDAMLRVCLIKISPEEHVLAAVFHHIAFDGWSVSIMVQELVELYKSFTENRTAVLKELPVQYADYAAWQRNYLSGETLQSKLSYWTQKLGGVEPLELVTDHPRTAEQSIRGGMISRMLNKELLDKIERISRQQGSTLFMTLLGVFKILLHRYTGQEDICVGTPVAGRQQQEVEGLIGFFVNTLALRSSVNGSTTVRALLEQIRQTTLDAYEHQQLPFEKVVEALGVERDMSRTPVFQVMFALQNTPESADLDLGGVTLGGFGSGQPTAMFDLSLDAASSAEGIHLRFTYCSDLFEAATIARMAGHYENLLEAVVADIDRTIAVLPMLPSLEEEQLLNEFNSPSTPYTDKNIIELFEEQVLKTPDATAIVSQDASITYRELNQRANQVANYLNAACIEEESIVAICQPRGVEMIAAMLGVLKSGGAYVAIDPEYPEERIHYMLQDSNSALVLNNLDDEEIRQSSIDHASKQISLSSKAYVIYTSGSTGKPKGVVVEHRSLVNYCLTFRDTFSITTSDKVIQQSSVSFDTMVEEIYPALISGAYVLIVKEGGRDINTIRKYIEQDGATVLSTTPLVLEWLNRELQTAGNLRWIISGGDVLHARQIDNLFEKTAIVNTYGPSETTVCASYHFVKDIKKASHIGKPIQNVQAYVLDDYNNIVPIGIPGELHIGGVQVAREYLNLPTLTEQKFIAINPKSPSRVYKTGDIVKWLPDGSLEFLGRKDEQVKIRGYRIELGEIEDALQQVKGVKQAVVVAKKDKNNNKRLVGYVVMEDTFDQELIMQSLQEKLPEYMVPAVLMEIESIPLTASGKVNKRALPEADDALVLKYEAPRNEVEQKLALIWQELLQMERVGIHDNFFTLGGHSLMAMRLISAIRTAFAKEIAVKEIFYHPTLAGLAGQLEKAQAGNLLPAIKSYDRNGPIPLSFSQERLWFIDRLQGSLQYHMPWVFRLSGSLDVAALEVSFMDIIDRHEVLRTTIGEEDGVGYQNIREVDGWRMQVISEESILKSGNDLASYLQQWVKRPYDLSNDFMLRVTLIQTEGNGCVLAIMLHHIAFDGWSISIMVKELVELYKSYTEGRTAVLKELPIQFADYAVWQRNYLSGETLETKLAYWKQQLQDVEALALQTDHPRPAVQSIRGEVEHKHIGKAVADGLVALSKRNESTLFMALLSAFKILLCRYTGQQDICIGTPTAGRQQQETEGLLGFFVNTLALRTKVNTSAGFTELLQEVKKATLDAYEHQDVPFEKIVEVLGVDRDLSRTPVFQVMFGLQNVPESADLELGTVDLRPEGGGHINAKFDLNLSATNSPEGLELTLTYCSDLFEASTVKRMLHHYGQLLESVLNDVHAPVAQLNMLSEEEAAQLSQSINRSSVEYPRHKTVVDLFEEQAMRTPAAAALMFDGTSVNYKTLHERSSQLAQYLRSKSVGVNDLVPVCINDPLQMILGMLGVLKAGAAYVPVDHALPVSRIEYMIADSKASVVVSGGSVSSLFNNVEGIEVIDIDGEWDQSFDASEKINSELNSSSPAYVIYTSGSTGLPKGVMISHQSLVDYVFGLQDRVPVEECKSFALVSTLSADLGNTVIYSSLLLGGTLHLFTKDTTNDPYQLNKYFNDNFIDCLKIVPSHWKALCMHDQLLLPKQWLIFGGEPLPAEIVEDIHSSGAECGIVNHYGPTETTIGKLLHKVEANRKYTGVIPIGKPFSNTSVYVLTKQMQLCPVGVPGELYIAGDGLAKGYIGKPELTAERFIKDPFAKDGSLIYRTGDLVKYLPDGNILFLGRADEQVKIRGYRIELGEIEKTLQQVPGVQNAVVIADKDNNGNQRLVAYVVASEFSKETLRAYLKDRLPDYMIPAVFMQLESIPLNANGKVDRKQLPAADASLSINVYEAPRNNNEAMLAAIWQELLKIERAGIHDNFFELGGHSLLAMRMVSAIRKQLNLEVAIREVFLYPTIAQLAENIAGAQHGIMLPAIERYDRSSLVPLSFSQERLWFIDRLQGSVQYHRPWVFRFEGELNIPALQASLRSIIARHEVLRSVIREEDGSGYQFLLPAEQWEMQYVLQEYVLAQGFTLHEYIENIIQQPYDLSTDFMLRVTLIRISDEEHVLAAVMHHIASDGWSVSILVQELMELYHSSIEQRPAVLKELPVQYADYAIWQRKHLSGQVLDDKLNYWKEQLRNVEPLELVTDHPRSAHESFAGGRVDRLISKELKEGLVAVTQQEQATLFMCMLGVFNILLHRYTGQQNICVGSAIAGRQRQEVEGLIGFFVNMLAMNTKLDERMSFREVLQQVKETTLGAYEHQDVPFEKVVDVLGVERDMTRHPLFQVVFGLYNAPDAGELELGAVNMSDEGSAYITSEFDLSMMVHDTPGGLMVSMSYRTDLFEKESMERMLAYYENLLHAVVSNVASSIAELSLLSAAEEEQLLLQFNDTATDYPKDKTIVSLFEEQVQLHADEIALISGQSKLTYKELDERSNQLSNYLIRRNVLPGDMVGTCLDRSAELIVSILAILKAGAAYVPVDPDYPVERINYLLQDSGIKILLTNSNISLPEMDVEQII